MNQIIDNLPYIAIGIVLIFIVVVEVLEGSKDK